MTLPVLRNRARGPDVQRLQEALIAQCRSNIKDCLGAYFERGQTFEPDGIFRGITLQALRAFQRQEKQTNLAFEVDGICGSATWAALGVTSAAVPRVTAPAPVAQQGRRPRRNTRASSGQVDPPIGETMPSWMRTAWQEEAKNVREVYGGGPNQNNRDILKYIAISGGISQRIGVGTQNRNARNILQSAQNRDAARAARAIRLRDPDQVSQFAASFQGRRLDQLDETPWCGFFVQWCLSQNNFPRRRRGPGSAGNWRPSEEDRSVRQYGAVCVIGTRFGNHVGFYVGGDGDSVTLLGGNHTARGAGSVCVKSSDSNGPPTFLWPDVPSG
jgi:uncharacterized protein (TIGR02594 family)